MRRVLLLPSDPVHLEFPQVLARVAGLLLHVPPSELLGRGEGPGHLMALAEWLWREAPAADVALVSLEALCLGGPGSPQGAADRLEEVLARLEVLRDLKRSYPHLRILAHGVVGPAVVQPGVAFARHPSAEADPVRARFSEWADRLERLQAMGKDTREALTELDRARLHLHKEALQRWLQARERNHALHQAAIDLLHAGVLEYLALTLDNPTPYGLPHQEARRLSARLDELGLWGEADIYPGGAEAPLLLLARALLQQAGRKTKVLLRYPSSRAEQAELLFQDRSLGGLVRAQLRALGGVQAGSLEEADLVLAVNAPALRQGLRQPDYEGVDTPERYLPELVDRLVADQATGRMVAVADLAYYGQAEHRFVQFLLPSISLPGLAGFAAWGSAANSLGSALAVGVCALFGDDPVPLAEAHFFRLVEDWLYASRVRPEVEAELARELGAPSRGGGLDDFLWVAERLVGQRLTPLAQGLWQRFFAPSLPGVKLEWAPPKLCGPDLLGLCPSWRLVREGEE
ncbi:MAG: DUF4127 family protein [Meiothermus sp.]|nr:DUF4127 family protein [Meiothermus sp.]